MKYKAEIFLLLIIIMIQVKIEIQSHNNKVFHKLVNQYMESNNKNMIDTLGVIGKIQDYCIANKQRIIK